MRSLQVAWFLSAAFLLAGGLATADVFEWTGAGAGDSWDDSDNWNLISGTSGRLYPNSTSDTATVTAFGADLTIDVSTSFSVGGLTAGNASHKLTFGGTGGLVTNGADWNTEGVVQFDVDVDMGNFKDLYGTSDGMTIVGAGNTFTSSRQPRLRHPFRIFGAFNSNADVVQVRDRLEVATDGDMSNGPLNLHGGGQWEIAAYGADRSVNVGINRVGNRSGKFDGTNGYDLAFVGSNTLGAIGAITDGTTSLEVDTSKLTLGGTLTLNENDGFHLHPVRVTNGGTLELTAQSTTAGIDLVVDGNGTLLLNNGEGSATGTGNTLVVGRQNWVGTSSVTLGGTGSTDSALVVGPGGTVAPGQSIGDLGVGTATFEEGATLSVEVNSDDGTSDTLVIGGDLDLSNNDTLVLSDLGTPSGGTHTIATYTGTLHGAFDDLVAGNTVFTIDDVDYATPGTIRLRIPEPSTVLLLTLGATLGFVARRRR